jgi:catechol 2,3-dioxygenase-like lactoylglutathione lyase family enzyme
VKISSATISLTVDDVPASSTFLTRHFGFHVQMSADGFAALNRDDAPMSIVLLHRGIEVLPEALRDRAAAGVIVAFVVDDLAGEEARLRAEGVEITLPIREEPWGERLFLVTDPNGLVYELVEWAEPAAG